MIDDKDLEERAEAYALDAWGEGDETLEGDSELTRGDAREFCERDFTAGARSQDELAYQRGRREALDNIFLAAEKRRFEGDLRNSDYLTWREFNEIIDQLRTEVKG